MHAKSIIGGDPKKALKAEAARAASKKKHAGKSVSIFSLEGSYRLREREAAGALKRKASARTIGEHK